MNEHSESYAAAVRRNLIEARERDSALLSQLREDDWPIRSHGCLPWASEVALRGRAASTGSR
jgi:hypothetical protein